MAHLVKWLLKAKGEGYVFLFRKDHKGHVRSPNCMVPFGTDKKVWTVNQLRF